MCVPLASWWNRWLFSCLHFSIVMAWSPVIQSSITCTVVATIVWPAVTDIDDITTSGHTVVDMTVWLAVTDIMIPSHQTQDEMKNTRADPRIFHYVLHLVEGVLHPPTNWWTNWHIDLLGPTNYIEMKILQFHYHNVYRIWHTTTLHCYRTKVCWILIKLYCAVLYCTVHYYIGLQYRHEKMHGHADTVRGKFLWNWGNFGIFLIIFV